MGEAILYSVLAVCAVVVLYACCRGAHRVRRVLFHAGVGLFALTVFHIGGHALGISFLPHWNLLCGTVAGILGLPGLALLTVLKLFVLI